MLRVSSETPVQKDNPKPVFQYEEEKKTVGLLDKNATQSEPDVTNTNEIDIYPKTPNTTSNTQFSSEEIEKNKISRKRVLYGIVHNVEYIELVDKND